MVPLLQSPAIMGQLKYGARAGRGRGGMGGGKGGSVSDHETKQTPFLVNNTLFMENVHFRAPGAQKG